MDNSSLQILFPHPTVRPVQQQLMKDIHNALEKKQHILAHAPTGLGKSAASLSVAVAYALEKKLTVFFLTSRHTQHKIAVDTLQEIQKKHAVNIQTVDLIGKKHMCPVSGVDKLYSGEFTEYCKQVREEQKCDYYVKSKKNHQLTVEAKHMLAQLSGKIFHNGQLVSITADQGHCPYEMAIELSKTAQVIIADYNYIFNEHISENFLRKIGKRLEECVIIIDEAHNLPARIQAGSSVKATTLGIKRAMKEAEKYNYTQTREHLQYLENVFNAYTQKLKTKLMSNERAEMLLKKEDIILAIEKLMPYAEFVKDITFVGEAVLELQKRSFIHGIANFLERWKGQNEGFARIASLEETRHGQTLEVSYTCLDPSLVTKEIVASTYACIFMSGTLTPTEMYADLLGVGQPKEVMYPNPFPEENRLNLLVPKTTTKFSQRSEQQFEEIASYCTAMVDAIPGNSIVFFSSYRMRDKIYNYLYTRLKKTIFLEQPDVTKEERFQLLERFKQYKDTGAVLLAVVSGSYGEGIDLAGDLLKGVIVVGLPLQQPTLETKELIAYYDKKFGKGWYYGYVYPAFTKTLQNAGRCIRSETDVGVIVFLDERYLWPMYKQCFPEDMEFMVTKEPAAEIRKFFEGKKTSSRQ